MTLSAGISRDDRPGEGLSTCKIADHFRLSMILYSGAPTAHQTDPVQGRRHWNSEDQAIERSQITMLREVVITRAERTDQGGPASADQDMKKPSGQKVRPENRVRNPHPTRCFRWRQRSAHMSNGHLVNGRDAGVLWVGSRTIQQSGKKNKTNMKSPFRRLMRKQRPLSWVICRTNWQHRQDNIAILTPASNPQSLAPSHEKHQLTLRLWAHQMHMSEWKASGSEIRISLNKRARLFDPESAAPTN